MGDSFGPFWCRNRTPLVFPVVRIHPYSFPTGMPSHIRRFLFCRGVELTWILHFVFLIAFFCSTMTSRPYFYYPAVFLELFSTMGRHFFVSSTPGGHRVGDSPSRYHKIFDPFHLYVGGWIRSTSPFQAVSRSFSCNRLCSSGSVQILHLSRCHWRGSWWSHDHIVGTVARMWGWHVFLRLS